MIPKRQSFIYYSGETYMFISVWSMLGCERPTGFLSRIHPAHATCSGVAELRGEMRAVSAYELPTITTRLKHSKRNSPEAQPFLALDMCQIEIPAERGNWKFAGQWCRVLPFITSTTLLLRAVRGALQGVAKGKSRDQSRPMSFRHQTFVFSKEEISGFGGEMDFSSHHCGD